MTSTPVIQVGVKAAVAKSYAYDSAAYLQPDPIQTSIAAAANSNAKITSFTQKQLKSVTVVPTVAAGANDQIFLSLVTLAAVAFGTATGPSYQGNASGTNTATSSSTITIQGSVGGGAGTAAWGLGTTPAFNPAYLNVAGGTFTVVVANAAGTNTQTNFVFPTGPLGGLQLNPGDVLTLQKGTDTAGAYLVELECTFTPGSSLTL